MNQPGSPSGAAPRPASPPDTAAASGTAPSGTAPHDAERELLQSVVETARAIFGAQAASIFLLDEAAGELVFQAVAGQGADFLVGTRFPAGRGVAGWVALSGEPMVVDDLSGDQTFARDLAESTRFVPQALMAAPLLCNGRVLGVLEVLDPAPQSRSDLGELALLALFARQAATALRVVTEHRERTATALLAGSDERARGRELLDALRGLLDEPR
jgi:GAF domain-containing protein